MHKSNRLWLNWCDKKKKAGVKYIKSLICIRTRVVVKVRRVSTEVSACELLFAFLNLIFLHPTRLSSVVGVSDRRPSLLVAVRGPVVPFERSENQICSIRRFHNVISGCFLWVTWLLGILHQSCWRVVTMALPNHRQGVFQSVCFWWFSLGRKNPGSCSFNWRNAVDTRRRTGNTESLFLLTWGTFLLSCRVGSRCSCGVSEWLRVLLGTDLARASLITAMCKMYI